MGGHKDIRRHTRTLREDKAMCWGKARTWWGWNSVEGGPLCRGGPRGLQGVFRGAPGWIWVVPGASQQVFAYLRVDLGDPKGGEGPQGGSWGGFGGI